LHDLQLYNFPTCFVESLGDISLLDSNPWDTSENDILGTGFWIFVLLKFQDIWISQILFQNLLVQISWKLNIWI
jgi:hypothetical protein